jgi:hypothetical protein
MFVRIRQTPYGMQLSLIQTRREGGKVRHEHIAGLGAITIPASLTDRIIFWRRLHARLSAHSNRIGDERGKILGAVHEQIPIPTPGEQRDVQLANGKVDQRFWEGLHGLHADMIEGHKGVIAAAERAITSGEAGAANAATHANAAKERVERIARGETVEGGFSKPLTRKETEAIMMKAGMTRADIRRCVGKAELPEELHEVILSEVMRRTRLAENAAINAVWLAFQRGGAGDQRRGSVLTLKAGAKQGPS